MYTYTSIRGALVYKKINLIQEPTIFSNDLGYSGDGLNLHNFHTIPHHRIHTVLDHHPHTHLRYNMQLRNFHIS